MALHDTRAELLATVLRSGHSARIVRVLDRLAPADLGRLMTGLGDLELRRAASVLFSPTRVMATLGALVARTVSSLISTATEPDAVRALSGMDPHRAAEVLVNLPPPQRACLLREIEPVQLARIIKSLPRGRQREAPDDAPYPGLNVVFRLRRLFA